MITIMANAVTGMQKDAKSQRQFVMLISSRDSSDFEGTEGVPGSISPPSQSAHIRVLSVQSWNLLFQQEKLQLESYLQPLLQSHLQPVRFQLHPNALKVLEMPLVPSYI